MKEGGKRDGALLNISAWVTSIFNCTGTLNMNEVANNSHDPTLLPLFF